MRRVMRIPFVKLHGLGNDFVVSSLGGWSGGERKKSLAFLRRLATAVCERHTGVGADGFLLAGPPRNRSNHAGVRFFNADGSEAEMSGNGIRCAAACLFESGGQNEPLRIETLVGVKVATRVKGGKGKHVFRVGMGRPILDPAEIPFRAKEASAPVVGYALALKRGEHRATVTSMGNPHCSIFVKNFDGVDWPAAGFEIETHKLFPHRTNVEFVKVVSRREIEVRYWERGVGITASSGTGSCAAVVASVLNGFTDRRVRVRTVAGTLQVEWPEGGEVILEGPAQWIAEGVYSYLG
jgi:diaminopimelate epimerase